ncbi:hypothetical protein ABZT03_04950 [Streptomyces sp. NPDC005574]|uniref:hypothetical protein n=1 Tax=Streptomyces sp. NPDC005574 TaxID=3156891 RepID=UPI0033A0A3D9
MKRRTLPVAVALAASAALLLTACGGGDEDTKASDKIAGTDSGDTTTSASPSASPASGQYPKVTLPSDVTNVFAGWKAGDPTKDDVLADASRRIDALDYAITESNADTPVLSYYYTGDALVGASQWVRNFVDSKKSMTGETRYFKPAVDVYATGKATLTYCSFEGKAYVKDLKTGKAQKTPVTDRSYLLFVTRLEKSAKGVWRTATLTSERGNSKCTP